MIQRKQTLWLLLSVICAALTFKYPFYNGTIINGTTGVEGAELTATDNIFLLLLSAAVMLVGLLTIFLFKNRKLQVQLTIIGLVLSVGLIALYFYYTQYFEPGGRISLTALFTVFSVVGFFMALRGIRSDQKLIRDLNRLR